MSTQFGDQEAALRTRQIIERTVIRLIDRERPSDRYGIVTAINRDNRTASVRLSGAVDSVPVNMGAIQPTATGQVVRVGGTRSDRWIIDVIGQAALTTTGSTTGDLVPPTGFTLESFAGAITASWDLTDPPLWELQIADDEAMTDTVRTFRVTGTSKIVNSVQTGQTYYGRIRTTTYDEFSDWSDVVSVDVIGLTVSQVTDGWPPEDSPDVVCTPGIGWVLAEWTPQPNADPVVYEVYLSSESGFTPSPETKASETSSTFFTVRKFADDSPLSYDHNVFVRVIAKDADGPSPIVGAQGFAKPLQVELGDVGNTVDFSAGDGSTPTASPSDLEITAGIGFLYAKWSHAINHDALTYELHMSDSAVYTPTLNTLVGETPSTFAFIRKLPNGLGGGPLDYDTTYYISLWAKDQDGYAPNASATVSTNTVRATQLDFAELSIGSAQIIDAAIVNAKIADAAIDSAKIVDAAITRAKIGNAAIGSAQIADAAIDSAKIGSAAITTAKIANAAIDTAQIAVAAITTTQISDAAITTAKIGDAQITDAKIANLSADKITAGTITANRISGGTFNGNSMSVINLTADSITTGILNISRVANGAITDDKIADFTIQSGSLGSNSIDSSKLQNSSVGNANIVNGAITNGKIANATITDAKIANLSADKITAGDITGVTITGVTITGGLFRTSTSGKRVELSSTGTWGGEITIYDSSNQRARLYNINSSVHTDTSFTANFSPSTFAGVRFYFGGSNGFPAMTFSDDTDTGFYRGGANDLRVSAGGATQAKWTSGPNQMFTFGKFIASGLGYSSSTSGEPIWHFNAGGDELYRYTSTGRLKLNQQSLRGDVADKVLALRPRTFDPLMESAEGELSLVGTADMRKSEKYRGQAYDVIGLIAEEVAEDFPEAAVWDENEEVINVDWNAITSALILQVKDMYDRITTQEEMLVQLASLNEETPAFRKWVSPRKDSLPSRRRPGKQVEESIQSELVVHTAEMESSIAQRAERHRQKIEAATASTVPEDERLPESLRVADLPEPPSESVLKSKR